MCLLKQIKKKPNRKPFPKDNAVYAQCGQRCDLCVHYTGTSDEQRLLMEPYLVKIWGTTDWKMRCEGCYSESCYCKDDPCNAKGCAPAKGLAECKECVDFPCIKATAADYRSMIHTEVHYADEITWAILPYVPSPSEKSESCATYSSVWVWDIPNKQKSLFLVCDSKSDFYGKGTPFLCLL